MIRVDLNNANQSLSRNNPLIKCIFLILSFNLAMTELPRQPFENISKYQFSPERNQYEFHLSLLLLLEKGTTTNHEMLLYQNK